MQMTADRAGDPNIAGWLADQTAWRELMDEWASSGPVVEVAVTSDGASVATLASDVDEPDPLVWVARPVDAAQPPEPVRLSSLSADVVPHRLFVSLYRWRDTVPTVGP